jgi:hypothetical protein
VVDEDGQFKWSGTKSSEQVALMLGAIAHEVRLQSKREMAEEIESGAWDVAPQIACHICGRTAGHRFDCTV